MANAAEVAHPAARSEDLWKKCTITLGFFVLLLIGGIIGSSFAIRSAHRKDIRDHRLQEISLKNFTVSNLNIIDDRISGEWTIGLSLKNPACKTTVYTDIKYTVVLSAAPDVPIVDFDLGYYLLQHSNNITVIYLRGSAKKVPLRHLTADSTVQDVMDGKIVKFDLLMVVDCKNADVFRAGKLELTCKGIKVLISPSKSAPVNATGFATEIPVCDLENIRVKDTTLEVGAN